MIFVCA